MTGNHRTEPKDIKEEKCENFSFRGNAGGEADCQVYQ